MRFRAEQCVHAVMQANGVLGPQAQLLCIGIITRQFWLKANARIGIDFELNPAAAPGEQPLDSGALAVDLSAMTARIQSQNAVLRIRISKAGMVQLDVALLDRCAGSREVPLQGLHPCSCGAGAHTAMLCARAPPQVQGSLSADRSVQSASHSSPCFLAPESVGCTVLMQAAWQLLTRDRCCGARRFANPLGVLGAPYRNQLDLSQASAAAAAGVAWPHWRLPRDSLWSHGAPGQVQAGAEGSAMQGTAQ